MICPYSRWNILKMDKRLLGKYVSLHRSGEAFRLGLGYLNVANHLSCHTIRKKNLHYQCSSHCGVPVQEGWGEFSTQIQKYGLSHLKFLQPQLLLPNLLYDVIPPMSACFLGPEALIYCVELLCECQQQPDVFIHCVHQPLFLFIVVKHLFFLIEPPAAVVVAEGLQILTNCASYISIGH